MTFSGLRSSLLLAALGLVSCARTVPSSSAAAGGGGPAQYVNPLIGTAAFTDPKLVGYVAPPDWHGVWAGLAFPGSALPNAMVQLSPVTEFNTGSGYQYEDTLMQGFAHTNKGHWNLCHVPVLPVTGPARADGSYASRFSHATETAAPGYYGVTLDDYQVQVQLTSTLRCGLHRYTFARPQGRSLVFKLGRSNERVNDWTIEQVGPRVVQGFQKTGEQTAYFYAQLSADIQDVAIRGKGTREGLALVKLADGSRQPVELRLGLSFVSTANARQNLAQELGNRSFAEVRRAATATWNQLLTRVTVKGGTAQQRTMFYTCLYRSFLWPALRSDSNGEYTDVKGQVVKADFQYYTLPSLWDTYRNKDVLMSMLAPGVTADIIKSMQDIGHKTGFIPTFFHGDHAASFVAGAYQRGVTGFDVPDVYRLLLHNATAPGGTRPYLPEYLRLGYVPTTEVAAPEVETKGSAGVSKTLEYAYDDYAVAQLARALHDTAQYRALMARSKNYRNVFDSGTKFMRGRQADGQWVRPFNPQYPYYEYMYREANAWQVSFFAPHDMPGLVQLYGGPGPFEAKLDSLFTVPWNPAYIARNVSGFIGQYCHGNQPDHEAPFAYYYVGKPEKSQRRLDEIMAKFYNTGEKGLAFSGMDDAGEMSAWYVFSAAGLYPLSAADARYVVTLPLFDEVRWTMPSGKVLTMTKSGASRRLSAIQVNGAPSSGYFVPYQLFSTGGQIEVVAK